MLILLLISFILLFAIFSSECIPATIYAIQQVLFTVIPSIFPFYVVSEVLIRSGFSDKLSKICSPLMRPLFGINGNGALAFLLGSISGYPAGAKITADLYKSGNISLKEASLLCAFSNNTGPLFMIGAVGTGMLSSPQTGFILWLIHIFAALISGILISLPGRKSLSVISHHKYTAAESKSATATSISVLTSSILSAARTMLPIGGTIVFFAAFTSSLKASGIIPLISSLFDTIISPEASMGILTGIFEITGGMQQIASSPESISLKMMLISSTAGWAGISVHMQVIGILTPTGIPCGKYLLCKMMQAFLSCSLTLIVASCLL